MELGAILLMVFVIAMSIISSKRNKKMELNSLRSKITIFSTEEIGRPYVALGMVSSELEDKVEAETDLLKQALKLGADAIVGYSISTSTHSSGGVSMDRGLLGMGKANIKDTSEVYSDFHYYGTAVKINKDI